MTDLKSHSKLAIDIIARYRNPWAQPRASHAVWVRWQRHGAPFAWRRGKDAASTLLTMHGEPISL